MVNDPGWHPLILEMINPIAQRKISVHETESTDGIDKYSPVSSERLRGVDISVQLRFRRYFFTQINLSKSFEI